MSPDLLRGMGKSIGGDLNVDDEGSEPRMSRHELALPRRLCPYKRIKNTSKNRKEQSRIVDE
jgi:hypothetical protein